MVDWQRRFQQPTLAWTALASRNPARGLACTDRDGTFQLHAWDVNADTLTQLTTQSGGVQTGAISADGQAVYYLHTAPNSQTGHVHRLPFDGGQSRDLTPDMPTYASWYITESESGSHLGFVAAALVWGFRIYILDAGGNLVFTYESDTFAVGPNLSYGGELAVIASDDRGTGEFTLEAYDVASGGRIAQLRAADGAQLQPIGFIPQPDNLGYLALRHQDGQQTPLLWYPATGEQRDLMPDLSGEIALWDATGDGRYLLLSQLHQACYRLHRYDLHTGETAPVAALDGTLHGAYWSTANRCHALVDEPSQPSHIAVIDHDGTHSERLLSSRDTPDGYDWQSISLAADDGTSLQAWLILPDGEPPFPTILHAHGGPLDVVTPAYQPRLSAWVDAGFAVCAVNYRGSTGFGADFQQAINGQPGLLESDDLATAARHLLAQGIARPDALVCEGASYGAYLVLMALARHRDLWTAGLATAAIADWEMLFRDESLSPPLRTTVAALFGGTPDDRPDAYRHASPLHLPQLPSAPLLILQPRQDAACPPQQMIAYAGRIAEAGARQLQVRWYNATPPQQIAAQHIEQHAQQRAFLQQILSGA